MKKENIKHEKISLEESIREYLDFEEHLNDICEDFKNIIGATLVYLFKNDCNRIFPKRNLR